MRHRLPESIVHFDLAARHRRRRHVEDERLLLHRGRSKADRIRAEDRCAAEGRDAERARIRHADADQVVLERHEGVVARDAVVIRIADRDHADRGVPRLVDGQVHRFLPHDLAEALTPIDEGRRLRLPDHTTLVRRLHGALLEAVHIAPEARDAVGVNPAKVGEDEDVRRHAGIFRGDTQLGEDLFAESTEGLLLNRERVRHPRAPSRNRRDLARISLRFPPRIDQRFRRSSSRKDFGARSVATETMIRGRPRACFRRKASVRRRSCFQHSRSHVPTARWTQNSSSYRSFSRSSNGRSSSPARTNRWSAYVDARLRQMFLARVQRRVSRNREGFAYSIPAIGPDARPSLSPHPVAASTQRSASLHESSSRIFSYRPRTRIANDFSSNTGPDQSASARAFTTAALKSLWSFANAATMARIRGTLTPRAGTGEPTYDRRSAEADAFGAFRSSSTSCFRAAGTSSIIDSGVTATGHKGGTCRCHPIRTVSGCLYIL